MWMFEARKVRDIFINYITVSKKWYNLGFVPIYLGFSLI